MQRDTANTLHMLELLDAFESRLGSDPAPGCDCTMAELVQRHMPAMGVQFLRLLREASQSTDIGIRLEAQSLCAHIARIESTK